MKKLFVSLLVSTFLSFVTFAQNSDSKEKDISVTKAEEVLSQYFNATKYKPEVNFEKKLSISFEKKWEIEQGDLSTNEKYSAKETLLRHDSMSDKTDSVNYNRIAILNKNLFYRDYIIINGKSPPDIRRANLSDEQLRLDGEVRLLKWSFFTVFFPITFEAKWYPPIKLKHIGVAESKNEKADVLEGNFSKSVNFQLLFDQQTHLLTMWSIITTESDGKKKNRIFYFDDYKVMSGVKIATKIEIYQDDEINETRLIKNFDTNPTFPNDFFELK